MINVSGLPVVMTFSITPISRLMFVYSRLTACVMTWRAMGLLLLPRLKVRL